MSYFDDNEGRLTGLNLGSSFWNIPYKPTLETKQMQIQILSIQPIQKMSSKNTPYEVLDIAFKNLTFQGKVEGKQLMPFGGNAPGYAVLKNAQSGQVYEITVVKNAQGYNDWTGAALSDGSPLAQTPATSSNTPRAAAPGATSNSRGFETPEERAAKQVYIVRQSSLSAAVSALSVGSKSAVKPEEAIAYAKQLEAYVFGTEVKLNNANPADFSDMQDDVPL